MRFALAVSLFFAALPARAADDGPKATRSVDGKTIEFAAKGLDAGVPAVVDFLESCVAETETAAGYTEVDWKKATRGDHFRLVFGQARTVRVLNESFQVNEVVVVGGAIWVRAGDKIRRFTKYRFEKRQAFEDWLKDAPQGK